MQEEPVKILGNYNEFAGERPPTSPKQGVLDIDVEQQNFREWHYVISNGLELLNSKVNEVLRQHNPNAAIPGWSSKLTEGLLTFPRVQILDSDPDHPNWAGYYTHSANQITLIDDKILPEHHNRVKVFVHEYLHFLSHNGRDDSEQVDWRAPLASRNNVGFRRTFGLDIRRGTTGEVTGDYFLAFNEAVTEQLAIDIVPGVHETYHEYRELLHQVIVDAFAAKLGSKNQFGMFEVWSKERIKNYIYTCYFKGNLAGFTGLLTATYARFGITEEQFGLMTHKDDLPSMIERRIISDDPNGPRPSPARVAREVQLRLDQKTPEDYVTDILDSGPGDSGNSRESQHASDYDEIIAANNVQPVGIEIIGGYEYELDSHGLIIYHGTDAAIRLKAVQDVFDNLVVRFERGEIDKDTITDMVDGLLFGTNLISMLSDGFKEFYVYKHTVMDDL